METLQTKNFHCIPKTTQEERVLPKLLRHIKPFLKCIEKKKFSPHVQLTESLQIKIGETFPGQMKISSMHEKNYRRITLGPNLFQKTSEESLFINKATLFPRQKSLQYQDENSISWEKPQRPKKMDIAPKKIIEGEGKIWGRYPTVLDVPKGAFGRGQKVQPGMPRSLRKGEHQAVVGSSARPFAQHWSVALCRVPPAWSNPSWASGACPGSPPFDSNPQDKGAFRSGSDPSSCLPPEVGCWSHFRLSPILRTQTSSPGVLPMVLPGPASICPDNREHITTITRSSSVHTTW